MLRRACSESAQSSALHELASEVELQEKLSPRSTLQRPTSGGSTPAGRSRSPSSLVPLACPNCVHASPLNPLNPLAHSRRKLAASTLSSLEGASDGMASEPSRFPTPSSVAILTACCAGAKTFASPTPARRAVASPPASSATSPPSPAPTSSYKTTASSWYSSSCSTVAWCIPIPSWWKDSFDLSESGAGTVSSCESAELPQLTSSSDPPGTSPLSVRSRDAANKSDSNPSSPVLRGLPAVARSCGVPASE
mmetsp:Transcript_18030/g.40381  ORF Transcript_18030/g.40381 Transcript_18030/m.40381 type:complete len:251 (-) Transcript_18030:446-1198(-)